MHNFSEKVPLTVRAFSRNLAPKAYPTFTHDYRGGLLAQLLREEPYDPQSFFSKSSTKGLPNFYPGL